MTSAPAPRDRAAHGRSGPAHAAGHRPGGSAPDTMMADGGMTGSWIPEWRARLPAYARSLPPPSGWKTEASGDEIVVTAGPPPIYQRNLLLLTASELLGHPDSRIGWYSGRTSPLPLVNGSGAGSAAGGRRVGGGLPGGPYLFGQGGRGLVRASGTMCLCMLMIRLARVSLRSSRCFSGTLTTAVR